jgi:hypothetical protein
VADISVLARELLEREMRDRPAQFEPAPKFRLSMPSGMEVQPVNPEIAAGLGGAADALSTYSFLKRGTAQEENGMWGAMKGSPSKTALGVAGAALAGMGGRALLRKIGFKQLADMLAATQGGHQIGLAAENVGLDYFGRGGNSDEKVTAKVHNAITRKQ